MHRKRRASLRVRAHVGGVAEHLRQRNHCLDHLRSGAMLNALDSSAAAVQIADDRAHELFRYHHFHRHHRLQQYRAGFARRFLERHRSGDLEGHFVRIDFVIAAVVQDGLHIDHLVAREYAAFHGFLNALVDRLDVLLGNHATHDLVDELVALAGLIRLDADFHVSILAAAAGLPDVLAFRFRLLANRLAIRHLRLADVGLHVELAHHAVNDDLQVQLAHTADDRLSAVRIGRNLERRIFLRQLAQRDTHLFLIALRLRLYGYRNHRRRELDRLQRNRVLLIANGVTRGDVAQSDARADVAREDLVDLFALIGVHLQQATDALALPAAAV